MTQQTHGAVYSVVDVETTGLSPRTNRLVEIAVVDLDASGQVVGEYVTLLNPGRDVGPTRIHRIRASDVTGAPMFADVAGHLLVMLAGRTVVGHNVEFDWRFLVAEYARLGVDLPDVPRLCTMALADDHLDWPASRTLVSCCRAAGVPLQDHHSALADARATASLLGAYQRAARRPRAWWEQHRAPTVVVWPSMPVAGPVPAVTRSQVAAVTAETKPLLIDVVARLPQQRTGTASAATAAYLTVLDTALEDRRVTTEEAVQLRELAEDLRLSGPDVADLHSSYLSGLAATAWADGVVTDLERDDLRDVAHLLGLDTTDVDRALERAANSDVAPLPIAQDGGLYAGQALVFTGDSVTPRDELVAKAQAAGLRVTSSVSRKTALLVAADAGSESGKARRARELGTRMVSEPVFLRLLDAVRPAADNPAAASPPRPKTTTTTVAAVTGAMRSLEGRRVLLAGLTDAEDARVRASVTAAGGTVAAYVKDSLACVVAGTGPDDRRERAADLGVPIMGVDEFLQMFGSGETAADANVAAEPPGAAIYDARDVPGSDLVDEGWPRTAPPPTPPPGWYPDPWAATRWRWWDGTSWTAHIHAG